MDLLINSQKRLKGLILKMVIVTSLASLIFFSFSDCLNCTQDRKDIRDCKMYRTTLKNMLT